MQSLGGKHLLGMLEVGTRYLERNKEQINALNVFPVPDGDTGTNMALTLRAALMQAKECPADRIDEAAEAAARGALFGARGNSGVILSQYIRGFADGLAGKAEAELIDLVIAFESASARAYAAVMEPSEGTMLTIGRRAAEAARAALDQADNIVHLLELTLQASQRAVEETPTMLAVLRDAGVVDAGGQGMVVALEGALRAIADPDGFVDEISESDTSAGEAMVACSSHDQAEVSLISRGAIDIADIRFRYCTEFLVHSEGADLDTLRSQLTPLGDSLLVVGDASIVKVHIHTNHPGQALEICGELGNLADINIDNMVLQNEAAAAKHHREPSPEVHGESNGSYANSTGQVGSDSMAAMGVVAVAQGAGFSAIFADLGVASTIAGGQTMNPSTEEIQQAVESIPAQVVIILPNNRNIMLAARQAAALSKKEVHVLPTSSIPEGIAAMVEFDPERAVEQVVNDMTKAAASVRTGELTRAVRSVQNGSRFIQEGESIGLVSGDIVASGPNSTDVLDELVRYLCDDETELITLYYGAEIGESEAQSTAERLAQQFEHLEVECYAGGQTFYDYLIAVE